MTSVAVAENLFTPGPAPSLLGGRHRKTGRVVFPFPSNNPDYELMELPRQGRLWSWTIQRFRPKSPPYKGPEAFEPFAVGYVVLGDLIIVEGRLANVDFDKLHINMEMETVTLPFASDPDGRDILTYAFAPTESPS